MVDVSGKAVTAREAVAECKVRFPAAVAAQLRESGLRSAKGGIVDTAIVAGTMAVKRTHELIPFCHPLPIDGVKLSIDWHGQSELLVVCSVKTVHRTGVEMEALTSVSVAALAVIDMVKGVDRSAYLRRCAIVAKSGGRSGDWSRELPGGQR